MAFFLLAHNALNEAGKLVIRCAAPHQGMEIVVPDGKQAGANLAVGGDANPAAMPAERMRNRRDDSNFPNAVVEAVTPRGLAAGPRDLNQRPVFSHAAQDF